MVDAPHSKKSVRLAILGTRGLPARYGGFETFAEELSTRLVARGHEVTVFGRRYIGGVVPDAAEPQKSYRSVNLRATITLRHKYIDTPLAALTSLLDVAWRREVDVVLLCNAATSPFAWIPRLVGIPLAINVDGVERRRTKWNALGRAWYLLGEWCSVKFATVVVTDAFTIQDYYRQRYGCESVRIEYGAEPHVRAPGKVLAEFGLKPRQYILYVSRLEPENNALGVIEAYVASGIEIPLVVVGDAPYADSYKAELQRAASERVIFTGYQFGEAYKELRSNPALYIQATEVGGTHPALLEAMAYGNTIVANGVPEHYEVLGGAGEYYQKNDFNELARLLPGLLGDSVRCEALAAAAKIRAAERFSWDRITDAYESLIIGLQAGLG